MRLSRHAVQVFAAFIGFALLAGLLEAGFLLIKWSVFQRFTWMPVQALWMAPVANTAYLVAPALLVAGLAAWRPGWIRLTYVTGLLVFGLACSMLIVGFNGGLALWSVLLLGLGVAIRCAMMVRHREAQFGRLIQRTTPRLIALVMALGVLLPGWSHAREWFTMRGLPPAGNKPNVLLIILDTVRSASLSLYGHQRPTTPGLEELANSSTVFDLAIAPAPWTLPSHAAMFTGRWPHELRAGWHTPVDDEFPTLAEILQGQGYITAGFVANHYYTTRQSGLDRGFHHYEDLAINPKEILRSSLLGQAVAGILLHGRYAYQPERSTHRKPAGEIRASFLNWMDRAGERPWFAFLNLFDAHKPYRIPRSFRTAVRDTMNPASEYEETIRYLDFELGLLLDSLESRGALANTLVIITSDHGEQFGEHDLNGHGNSLYRRVIHVPLLLRYPGRVPAGRRITQPVSLRDLPRTVINLIGIPDSALPGVSLAESWNGGVYPDTVFAELMEALEDVDMALDPPMYALVTSRFEYIRQSNGTVELFSFPADSLEAANLADSPPAREISEHFSGTLDRHLTGAPKR